ncbi:hypothetical protein BKA56DRAFT_592675 [Ilyonectria sp. MPI-CAGE-AT-0026]|nr:hypothetical protein BKA56DRAFT_592675 [Ilyonectria sp. MPI-CAGE-AT-0026]
MGYFHYQTLVRKRRERLTPRPHPGRGNNGPVRRMYRRKLSKVTPQQWSRDPYLLCILLSLAQSQARMSRLPQPSIFVVGLCL